MQRMKYLHTMVRVTDIDRSLDFYCDKLGLKEIRRYDNEKGRFTLVFLAADSQRLKELDEGLRKYLAWESILDEKETLDLRPHQVKQAQAQAKAADGTVSARLPEAYQWLLVPVQSSPQGSMSWEALRLTGNEPLAVRASKKLRNEELLLTTIAFGAVTASAPARKRHSAGKRGPRDTLQAVTSHVSARTVRIGFRMR